MKKLSSLFLAVLMSFYSGLALSPALVIADSGQKEISEEARLQRNVSLVAAKNVRDSALDTTKNMRNAALAEAAKVRKSALNAALLLADKSDIKDAMEKARDNYKDASKTIRDNYKDKTKSIKDAYKDASESIRDDFKKSVLREDEDEDKDNIESIPVPAKVVTNLATNIMSADATLNGMNGPVAATGHSFWVSLAPFVTTSPVIPSGVYSTPNLGVVATNTAFSASLSSLATSGVPSNLPAITPNTTYYFAAWTLVNGTWYPGSVLSFTTSSTTPPADTTPPSIVFATGIGLSASTTRVIWVTNEPSNSRIWFGTTSPVSTTTAPVASDSTLSFFHQLSLPGLATSTLYYYTVSSTDASGNTSYYSSSLTTPTTL